MEFLNSLISSSQFGNIFSFKNNIEPFQYFRLSISLINLKTALDKLFESMLFRQCKIFSTPHKPSVCLSIPLLQFCHQDIERHILIKF